MSPDRGFANLEFAGGKVPTPREGKQDEPDASSWRESMNANRWSPMCVLLVMVSPECPEALRTFPDYRTSPPQCSQKSPIKE